MEYQSLSPNPSPPRRWTQSYTSSGVILVPARDKPRPPEQSICVSPRPFSPLDTDLPLFYWICSSPRKHDHHDHLVPSHVLPQNGINVRTCNIADRTAAGHDSPRVVLQSLDHR